MYQALPTLPYCKDEKLWVRGTDRHAAYQMGRWEGSRGQVLVEGRSPTLL